MHGTPTETEDCCEERIADLEDEGDGAGLVEMLDTHADHVEEDQHEDCDLKASRNGDVVEKRVVRILRSFYHFLRLFSAKFLHCGVVVFL